MAAPYNPPQEDCNPAYSTPSAQNESHEQAFPEPVKPQDQQYAGQVPPPGQPGGYYVQPQDVERNNSHLLIAWILFGAEMLLFVPLVSLQSRSSMSGLKYANCVVPLRWEKPSKIVLLQPWGSSCLSYGLWASSYHAAGELNA